MKSGTALEESREGRPRILSCASLARKVTENNSKVYHLKEGIFDDLRAR